MTVHFGNPPVTPAVPTQPAVKPQAAPAQPAAPAAATPAPAAPADQVQIQLPADRRQCADFDPAMGICPDTKAPPKTREEVGNALKSQGLPAGDVDTTLKYLDKINADYGDIGSLIQNQLSFRRDANDVLGAVQAYGVMVEGRALKIAGTDTPHYQTVMDGLKDGRVRIDKDTTRELKTEATSAEGHYQFDSDTVQIGSFNPDSAYARSYLFHELIHTRQDVDHEVAVKGEKPTMHDVEMDAYMAQAEFLVKTKVDPNGSDLKGHKILEPAMRIIRLQNAERKIRAQQPLDREMLDKIHTAIENSRTEMGGHLDAHYPTYRLEVPANGLHANHP